MCSTMGLIFNLYSTFNALFNIQLRIQHSTIHFIFNSLFTHSIIYSTISTIYSTFNLIQLFIQLFCALTTSGQWHRSLLVKNMAAMAAVAPSGSQNAGYGNRSLWRWHKAPLRCGVWLSKVSWLGSSKNWPDFPAAYCRCRSNGAVCLLRIPRCTPRQQFEYQRLWQRNLR